MAVVNRPHTTYTTRTEIAPQGHAPFLANTAFRDLGVQDNTPDFHDSGVLQRVKGVCEQILDRNGMTSSDESFLKDYLRDKGIKHLYECYLGGWKTPSSVDHWDVFTNSMKNLMTYYLDQQISRAAAADMQESRAVHAAKVQEVKDLGGALMGTMKSLALHRQTPGFHRYYDGCDKAVFVERYGKHAYDELKEVNDTFKAEIASVIGDNDFAANKMGYWMWISMGQPSETRARLQFGEGQTFDQYGYKVIHDKISSGPAAKKGHQTGFATLTRKLEALERMMRVESWERLEAAAEAFSTDKGRGFILFKQAVLMMPEGMDHKIYKKAWEICGKGIHDVHFGGKMMHGKAYHDKDHADVLRKFIEEDRKYPFAIDDHKQYERYGCHFDDDGSANFRVFAPNAKSVEIQILSLDGEEVENSIVMQAKEGDWEIKLDDVVRGETVYRYLVETADGEKTAKADPFAVNVLLRGGTWAVAQSYKDGYEWQDGVWMAQRKERKGDLPLNIMELNLGTYGTTTTGAPFPEIGALTESLIKHCKRQNVTQIELYGLIEHKDDTSLGYHVSQLFAPTSRYFNTPEKFKEFVNALHRANIGVIIDVSLNQLISDKSGLTSFDGTPLYEADEFESSYNTTSYGAAVIGYESPHAAKLMASHLVYMADVFNIDGFRIDYTIRNHHHTDSEQHTVDAAGIRFQQMLVNTVKKAVGDDVLIIEENGSRYAHGSTGDVGIQNANTSDVRWPTFHKDTRKVAMRGDKVVKPGVDAGFSMFLDLAATRPEMLPGYNDFWYALRERLGVGDASMLEANSLGGIHSHDNIPLQTGNQKAQKVGGFPHQRMCHALTYLLAPGVVTQFGTEVGSESGYSPVVMPDDRRETVAQLTADMGAIIAENKALWWREGAQSKIDVVYEHITDGIIATRWVHGDNDLVIIHNIGDGGCKEGRVLGDYKVGDVPYEVIFDSNDEKYREKDAAADKEYQKSFVANCETDADGNLKYWCLPESTLVLRRKT
jgi:hypothetical protein